MKTFLLMMLCAIACLQPDYAIIKPGETETVYVEVPSDPVTVIQEVEVPVYIEVEVPADNGEVWVDSFTQVGTIDGIDILWVIDKSGSMNRFDAALLAGIEAMMLALPASDWRLVIISADPTDSIASTEFPLVPGDDITDAENMLNTLPMGPWEEGFNSVYEYIINNPYSSTWMRPDAGLLVVFVSDEEEQSYVEYPYVSNFLSWYSVQRGGAVFMASIVNQPADTSMCTFPPSPIDVGDRYMEATSILGGIAIDICDEDWSPGVTDATHSIEPYESITLTHTPVVDSIRVFIDGALSAYGWTYSATDNTVKFTVVPTAGQLVEVGYRYIETDTGS